MCGGEGFWKRVVVFCLAFGLSVFVSDFFFSTESKPENVSRTDDSTPKVENCVPTDKSLKYQNLPYYENEIPALDSEPPVLTPRQMDKKAEPKKPEDRKQTDKNDAKAKPQFYVPEKDSAEYRILLHKEKCFETEGQK